MPPDETPAPTVKPESNYQGLYAEKEPLIVSSVAFEKDVPSYSLNYNDIYVISEEADSLKEFVPDVTKCTYNVYCYGKKAEVKSITRMLSGMTMRNGRSRIIHSCLRLCRAARSISKQLR